MRYITVFLFVGVIGLTTVSAQEADTLVSPVSKNCVEKIVLVQEADTLVSPVSENCVEKIVSAQSDTLVSTAPINNYAEKIDSLISFSKKFIGTKYRYGNNTPEGFDCSGFTGYVFSNFGYQLERSAANQYKNGISVSKKDAKAGDLVFFQRKNRNGTYRISHVGIIISVDTTNQTFRFIHSCSRGVIIDDSTVEYYQKRFYGIRRIIENEYFQNTDVILH